MAAPSPRVPRRFFASLLSGYAARPAPRRPQRVRSWLVTLLVGLTVLFGPGGILTSVVAQAAPAHPASQTPPTLTPMTLDQALANQAAAWGHASGAQQTLAGFLATAPHTAPQGATIPRQVLTPQPIITGSARLSTTQNSMVTTSDGRFSAIIPFVPGIPHGGCISTLH
jgi:hypothetical protein